MVFTSLSEHHMASIAIYLSTVVASHIESIGKKQERGILLKNTDVSFVKASNSNIRLSGASVRGGYPAVCLTPLSNEKKPLTGMDVNTSEVECGFVQIGTSKRWESAD